MNLMGLAQRGNYSKITYAKIVHHGGRARNIT